MVETLRAVVSTVPIEFTCSQESDIHSEGFTRFISDSLTPLVIAAVLACFLAADVTKSPEEISAQLKTAEVVNSLYLDDPCVPPVQKATTMILNSVDVQTTYQMCKAAHDAKRRAGLQPSAKGELKPQVGGEEVGKVE